jgi:putative protease
MAIKKKKIIRKRVKPAKAKAKKAVKKAAKKTKIKLVKAPEIKLEKIGKVTHYFPHVKAAAVKLMKSGIAVGDKIYIKGHTTDFKESVRSIQLDHVSIAKGKKGQEIGLFVKSRVRIGDTIYKV